MVVARKKRPAKKSVKKATRKPKKKAAKKALKKIGCDCIAQVNKALEEAGENTRIDQSLIMNFKTGNNFRTQVKIQTVKANSRDRKPMRPIIANFCPFCGKKYVTGKDTKILT